MTARTEPTIEGGTGGFDAIPPGYHVESNGSGGYVLVPDDVQSSRTPAPTSDGFTNPEGNDRNAPITTTGGTATSPTGGGNTTTTTGGTSGGTGSGGGDSGDGGDGNEEAAFIPQVIPPDATLIKVRDPAGSDDRAIYYLEYEVSGVRLQYEIGNRADFVAAFGKGGAEQFDNFLKMGQNRFDNRGGLLLGSADEQYGSSESILSQVERGVRAAGLEDIPDWMRNDPAAMTVLFQSTKEGWSSGRTLRELSKTGGFQERYPWLAQVQAQLGGSNIQQAIDYGVAMEGQLKSVLRRRRGPDTDVSVPYLSDLIASGWTATEVDQVLKFEQQFNPAALDNLNAILGSQGIGPVDEDGLLDIVQGQGAPEVMEALNDFLRQQALAGEGVDVDAALASELGTGVSGTVADAGAFAGTARDAAAAILANRFDLDLGKFGLTTADVVRAAFGQPGSAETDAALLQLARERSAAAQGFEGVTSFQDERGRLRTLGLKGL